MYYLIYSLLYLFSLLPFFILYKISDFAFFIMYYIVRYRKDIIFNNLNIAFPEKSTVEKTTIAKKFYKNITDTFIETIKLLSLSEKRFLQMAEMDLDEAIILAQKGKSIQFHGGHQFNWELANLLIAKKMSIPFIGVYVKISNKPLNRLFYDLRSKTGTILVATNEFKSRMHDLLKSQYSIGLAADQNAANPSKAFWLNFFNRPVPFVTGPDKAAIKNKTAVIFVKLLKVKRGKYKFISQVVTEDASTLKEGQLTLLYRDFLEETIRSQPENYLWSHRRWRWEYQEGYKQIWIDKVQPEIKKS